MMLARYRCSKKGDSTEQKMLKGKLSVGQKHPFFNLSVKGTVPVLSLGGLDFAQCKLFVFLLKRQRG